MIKRNSAIALGSVLAIAGCGAGGTSSTPAKVAATANHTLSTGHLTINPTLLKHASSSRRRPSFVDTAGDGNGGTLSIEVSTHTFDGLLSTPVTSVPLTSPSTPVTIDVPLYGPGGWVHVQEFNTQLASLGGAKQLIADNADFSDSYSVSPGIDTNLNLTLRAVLGGIVLSDKPDGSSASPSTVFIPLNNASNVSYTAPVAVSPFFLYAFPADAAGNFTALSVAGGFPNAVLANPVSASTLRLLPTNVLGVYSVCDTAGGGAPVTGLFSFGTTDGLGLGSSTAANITGGYLVSCPAGTP